MNGKSFLLWVGVVALTALFASCSVTRRIPSDAYLLNKTTIEIGNNPDLRKSEMATRDELDKYVRQHPPKRLLGTNLPVWLYLQADSASYSWWNRTKRRLGKEPVLLDTALTALSAEWMKIYMDARGFLNSSATYRIDTIKHKAKVTYDVDQGEPYRLGKISYLFREDFLRPVVLADTAAALLHTGDIYDINVLDNERARITRNLKNQGYYNFSVNNIRYLADSTAGRRTIDLTMVLRRDITGYDGDGDPVLENNRIYRIRNIYVHSNYDPVIATDSLYVSRLDTIDYNGLYIIFDGLQNIREEILRRAVSIYPNYLYSADGVQRTYENLMRLGYYRSANILFSEAADTTGQDNLVTFVGTGGGEKEGTAPYTVERYLDCRIFCTPATRQSYSVDLEGTVSDDYWGILAKVGYQNRNLFRGAGLFDAELHGGYEFMRKTGSENAFEIGASLSFTFPALLTPFRIDRYNRAFNPRTTIAVSYNIQQRPYYNRNLASVSWGYQWGNRKRSTFMLRPIDIRFVKLNKLNKAFYDGLTNLYLKDSYKSQTIAGLSGSYVYSTRKRDDADKNSGYLTLRFNYETAGNLLYGVYNMAGVKKKDVKPPVETDGNSPVEKAYHILGSPFAQYFRVDANMAKKMRLGDKTSLVYRFYVGWGYAYGNSSSLPFERLFYAGGVNSMRGWTARTLGAGNSLKRLEDEAGRQHQEEAGEEVTISNFPSQLANFKLETNLEFRFPIWGMMQGGLFADLGNIWYLGQGGDNEDERFRPDRFYKQLGFNTGVGLRFDFNFFVFRVDWGIRVHDPNQYPGERWVIKNFRIKNTALNIGVGYPF